MPSVTHLAIKVDNLDAESKLYETVFGFKYVSTVNSPGRVSRHLSDGALFLTLIKYDSEQSDEADLSGPGPCIHHFGVEVDDPARYEAALKEFGCEIISGSADKMPIKFRSADGIVAELLAKNTIPNPQKD